MNVFRYCPSAMRRLPLLHTGGGAFENRHYGLIFCNLFSKVSDPSKQGNQIMAKHTEVKPQKSHLVTPSPTSPRQGIAPNLNEVIAKKYMDLYYIVNMRPNNMVCRCAYISTIAFLVGSPVVFACASSEFLSWDNAMELGKSMGGCFLMFNSISLLFVSRILAKIEMSCDQQFIKLSHQSVFGKRRDIYTSPDNLMLMAGNISQACIVGIKGTRKKFLFFSGIGNENVDLELLGHIFTRNTTPKKQ